MSLIQMITSYKTKTKYIHQNEETNIGTLMLTKFQILDSDFVRFSMSLLFMF